MPYLTEKELQKRFEFYTMQLERQLLEGEDFNTVVEQVPFGVHFNDSKTLEVIHTNKLNSEITNHHIEEVREMGLEYFEKHVHSDTITYASEVLLPQYNRMQAQDTISFIQHVKKKKHDDFSPLFTFSKTTGYKSNLVMCLSLQPDDFEKMAPKMERIVKMDSFKLNHFKRFQLLTEREIEVLTLLASGSNNPQIAEKLFISRSTVETHRKNLKRKLDLRSFRDLMRYALAFDLIKF